MTKLLFINATPRVVLIGCPGLAKAHVKLRTRHPDLAADGPNSHDIAQAIAKHLERAKGSPPRPLIGLAPYDFDSGQLITRRDDCNASWAWGARLHPVQVAVPT
jgi:hypothetical protein